MRHVGQIQCVAVRRDDMAPTVTFAPMRVWHLFLLLRLQILVRSEREQATHKQHTVESDAEAGLTTAALVGTSADLVGASNVLRRGVAGHALQGSDH